MLLILKDQNVKHFDPYLIILIGGNIIAMKKIIVFSHNQYSHLTNAIMISKVLSNYNYEVHLFCGDYFKTYISSINLHNNIIVHYYGNKSKKEIDIVKKQYDKYVGGIGLKRDISTLENIKLEIKDMYEFILKTSLIYKNELLSIAKEINADLIIRDTCSLFGRFIGEELNLPIFGYATNTIITDSCNFISKKDFLELTYNIKLNNYTLDEIDNLYSDIKTIYNNLSKKYGIRPFPINYLMNPGEKFNFCFGIPYINNDNNNYHYFKPPLFYETSPIKEGKKKIIYVSAGSTLTFPAKIYNVIFNFANRHQEYKFYVTFKYKNANFIKLNNIPSNVILETFSNQKEVLKNSSLFISHGGFNSLFESIFYEVPIIIIPICSDQFLNAFFIQKRNIGIQLDWHNINCSDLLDEAIDNINFELFHKNLKNIKNEIENLPSINSINLFINEVIK